MRFVLIAIGINHIE